MYIHFTKETGWLSPVNIVHVENAKRPHSLRYAVAKACWAHETDWEHLRCVRPSLSQQCRIFFFILKQIFKSMQIPWQIVEEKPLKCIGIIFKVKSLRWRPLSTCNGNAARELRNFLAGSQQRRGFMSTYSTSSVAVPRPCGLSP